MKYKKTRRGKSSIGCLGSLHGAPGMAREMPMIKTNILKLNALTHVYDVRGHMTKVQCTSNKVPLLLPVEALMWANWNLKLQGNKLIRKLIRQLIGHVAISQK